MVCCLPLVNINAVLVPWKIVNMETPFYEMDPTDEGLQQLLLSSPSIHEAETENVTATESRKDVSPRQTPTKGGKKRGRKSKKEISIDSTNTRRGASKDEKKEMAMKRKSELLTTQYNIIINTVPDHPIVINGKPLTEVHNKDFLE